jgi:hypothetical protein
VSQFVPWGSVTASGFPPTYPYLFQLRDLMQDSCKEFGFPCAFMRLLGANRLRHALLEAVKPRCGFLVSQAEVPNNGVSAGYVGGKGCASWLNHRDHVNDDCTSGAGSPDQGAPFPDIQVRSSQRPEAVKGAKRRSERLTARSAVERQFDRERGAAAQSRTTVRPGMRLKSRRLPVPTA